jgi:hypothetical protein
MRTSHDAAGANARRTCIKLCQKSMLGQNDALHAGPVGGADGVSMGRRHGRERRPDHSNVEKVRTRYEIDIWLV